MKSVDLSATVVVVVFLVAVVVFAAFQSDFSVDQSSTPKSPSMDSSHTSSDSKPEESEETPTQHSEPVRFFIEFLEEDGHPCRDQLRCVLRFDFDADHFDNKSDLLIPRETGGLFFVESPWPWSRIQVDVERVCDFHGVEMTGDIVEFWRDDVREGGILQVRMHPIFAMESTLRGPTQLESGMSFQWWVQDRKLVYSVMSGSGEIGPDGAIRIVPNEDTTLEGTAGMVLTIRLENDEGYWVGHVPLGRMAAETQYLGCCTLRRLKPAVTGLVVDEHNEPLAHADVEVAIMTPEGEVWYKYWANSDGRFELYPRNLAYCAFSLVRRLRISKPRYVPLELRFNIPRNGRYRLKRVR